MSICIFYFSGTGNTWWTSNQLATELEIKGRPATVHSIELLDADKTAELIEAAETVVFGYPIYGSAIPKPMKQFIDGLPKPSKTKKACIFCTQMEFSGDGAWYYHKALEDKGYDVKWTYHFKLPSNICIRSWPLPYVTDEGELKKIFGKCTDKIKKAADSIIQDTASYTGNGFGSLMLGLLQRPFFNYYMDREKFKIPFAADSEKCVKCMRCIQLCPTGNIKLADGEITFANDCIFCMRCYNYCPKTAITAYGKHHNDKQPPYKGPEGFDPALIAIRKNLADFIE